uniref:Reverse transcriptase n=1 Tax=Mycena chlorophos TaxID=658473 RepID=A0ABQ0LAD9_MYCCL|nr:predicted protein [Mycena chlorophos]
MKGVDVLCVQEMNLRPDQQSLVPEVEGFEWFFALRKMPAGQKAWGGVATLVRRSLKARFCGEWSAADMLVLQIADLLLVNVYILPVNSRCDYRMWQEIHPWHAYLALLDNLAAEGRRVSSHGDLNARPGLEVPQFDEHPPRIADDLELKERGEQLLEVCTRNKYIIVNGCWGIEGEHGGFTFYRHADTTIPAYRSTIDFTIVSLSVLGRVAHMDILPRTTASFHCAIRTTLTIPPQHRPHRPATSTKRRQDLEPRIESALDFQLQDLLASSMTDEELNVHTYGEFFKDNEWRELYADGSCFHIGTPQAAAGAGVYAGGGNDRSKSLRVPGAQTNNRAELFAILAAVADTPLQYALSIRTDSMYAIQTITHLGPKLAQMGWRGANGDILAAIQYQIRKRPSRVVFHWVKGHSNNKSNDMADKLAKEGTRLPRVVNEDERRLDRPAQMPPPFHGSGRPLGPKVSTSLSRRTSGPDVRAEESQKTPRHRQRKSVRSLRGELLRRLEDAKKDSKRLWGAVNEIQHPRRHGRAEMLVDLSEMTTDYQRRMNPPRDLAAVGFDPDRWEAIKAAAAAIPTPSPPSRFPELNELVAVKDIERVKATWEDKTRSAPGIDHAKYQKVIPVDNERVVDFLNLCMARCEAPAAFVQAILSSVPKPGKDPHKPEGYRGIALQSTVYKAWSGVYTKRLCTVLDKARLIPPNQNGFRAGYRTYNNAFILRTMIDKSEASGEPLYVAFVDILNAFPSVNRDMLWLIMEELGLTGPFFDFIRMMYRELSVVVAHGGEVSEEWESLCGVIMGDPPSPTLWNLFLSTFKPEVDPDDVSLAGLFLAFLAHADDLALMSRTIAGLQRRLALLEKWCRLVFLIANGLKSAAMVFGRIPATAPELPPLSFGGSNIPWVMEHKYVGITFASGLRDIFRKHYAEKAESARKAYWATIAACDHYLGHGRLPPTIACNMYYALIDCHLTHACEVVLDVDPVSFALLEAQNVDILRKILGVGSHSSWPQLYTELGIYPLFVRRLEIPIRFLRDVVNLDPSFTVYRAMQESDRLRRKGFSSWLGDLSALLRSLPFPMPHLRSLQNISSDFCNSLLHDLRAGCKRFLTGQVQARISLHLLHNRLEPREDGPPQFVHLTRRHYLSRIVVPEHRLAVTRLLAGSFGFRGVHSDSSAVSLRRQMCRRCGEEKETPAHVFLVCGDPPTMEARHDLRRALSSRCGYWLPSSLAAVPERERVRVLQSLIFHWERVLPMARFIFRVSKDWKWFGATFPNDVVESRPGLEGNE